MTLFGQYELLALLAKGGLAEIWLARPRGIGGFEKLLVVKRLHERLQRDREYVDMFLDEARINARLTHGNVLKVHELGDVDGSYFLTMEYVEGLPLGVLAHHAVSRLGDLPIAIAGALIAQAARGLHYAHECEEDGAPFHVVHRDVSPLNLLVSWDGVLKIADFGIAKADGRRTRTRTGVVKGTPTYMSPEQCTGEVLDRRTDIFGLGILLWELLTGRRLFKRPSMEQTYDAIVQARVPPPSTYRVELSPAFDALVLRALSRRPADRFQTAAELATALEAALRNEGFRAELTDVRAFLAEHFRYERAEQRALLDLVRNGDLNANEPVFISAEHGLDSGEEYAAIDDSPEAPYSDGDTTRDATVGDPAATVLSPALAAQTVFDAPALTAKTAALSALPGAAGVLDDGVTPLEKELFPPRRPLWHLVVLAIVAMVVAGGIGLLAGRWSVKH